MVLHYINDESSRPWVISFFMFITLQVLRGTVLSNYTLTMKTVNLKYTCSSQPFWVLLDIYKMTRFKDMKINTFVILAIILNITDAWQYTGDA